MITKSTKPILLILVIGVIAFVGYMVLNAPDRRTMSDKLEDAAAAISDGADKAGLQLQNRTQGEKLKDATKDVGDDIKEIGAP